MSVLVQFIVKSLDEIASRQKIDTSFLEMIDVKVGIDRANLTPMEMAVIKVAKAGHTSVTGARELGMSKWKFKKLFVRACNKIAQQIGYEYSDEYLIKKHPGIEKQLRKF